MVREGNSQIMNYVYRNSLLYLIPIGMLGITFLEAQSPPATAVWVLYIPLISLTLFLEHPKVPLWLAAICSFWIFFDLFFLEESVLSSVMWARRTIGSIAFFSVGFIVRNAILVELKRKQAQADLKESATALAREKVKLERSNRELEQFAGVAAHDLRSPIKSIISWTDMLSMLIPQPRSDELEQALSIVRNNAKKADDLVEDVLSIARVNVAVANIGPVDLNVTLRSILDVLRNEIESVSAKVHISVLPIVSGNQTYLGSIFSNLIRNAITYRDQTRTPEISIGCTEHIDRYEFFVKDNGIGIKASATAQIFEMFKRLHSEKEYPGNGIGLAFCKKVVELSGGKIWVDTVFGLGSTFFFTHPKHEEG